MKKSDIVITASRLLRSERELDEVRAIPLTNRRLAVYRRVQLHALIAMDDVQRKLNAARSPHTKARWAYAVSVWRAMADYFAHQITAKCGEPF